ncbi:MAG: hypothetical protein ACTHLH_06935 [Solirubrobacterales bacterium]
MTKGSARRRPALLALASLAFALTLLGAARAGAATVNDHPFIGSLAPPPSATPKGPFAPIALDVNQSTGDLYAVDAENDVIDIFKPNGTFLGVIDGSNTPKGAFDFRDSSGDISLAPIAIDNSGGPRQGTIYVLDRGRQHTYDSSIIALSASGSYLYSMTGSLYAPWTANGILGLAVDSAGALRTAGEGSITLPGGGNATHQIWVLTFPEPKSEVISSKIVVDEHFAPLSLADLALDSQGGIYAVTYPPAQLGRIEPDGSLRWRAANSGADNAVEVDRSSDAVYAIEGVGDPGASYVSRYDTEGSLKESFGLSILSEGPRAVAVDESNGNVYVADKAKGSVEAFGPEATVTAPDVAVGAVTDLAGEPATATGDLSLLGTGTGDVKQGGVIEHVTIDSGTFSPGESIAGEGLSADAVIVSVSGETLIWAGSNGFDASGASLVSGSKTVTNFNPTNGSVGVGDPVYGTGIPKGTVATAVDGGTLKLSRGATEAASGVSITAVDSTATLNGTVNPQGVPSSWRFQYRRQRTKIWTSTPLEEGGSGTSDEAVSTEVSALSQNTTYEVRLQAVNSENGAINTSSNVINFTTPGLPQAVLTIDPASSLTPTGAHLSGTVDPNGSDAKWRFEYTTDDSLEENWSPVGEDQTVEAGAGATEVSAGLTGLRPNTHYFVRLVATNETGGPNQSEEIQFTTPPAPPVLLTLAAGCLTPTSACLAGYVDPKNSATTYYFEYGPDESYGSSVPASQDGDAGSGFGSGKVSERISGLQPGTTYHFRLVAANAAGTTDGPDMVLETRPDASQTAEMEAGWPARGYELVNTPEKGNQSVYSAAKNEPWISVSPDGNRVFWETPNGGPQSSTGALSSFVATYSPTGWSSRSLLPPASQLPSDGNDWFSAPFSFTPDFSHAIMTSARAILFAHFQRRLIAVDESQNVTTLATFSASADANVLVEASKVASGGRVVVGGGSASPAGQYPLTLYQPDGSAESVPVPACGYSQINQDNKGDDAEEVKTWVNSDASRIFLYSSGDTECGAPRGIYMVAPETGAITRVSGEQSAPARFLRANGAGTELLFTKGGDLYRWSDGKGEECLSCGSGYKISEGTASPDLSHVYFCGPVPPASPSQVECGIYVWRERGIGFVADKSEVRGIGTSGPTPLKTDESGSQMIFKSTLPDVSSADDTGWDGDFGAGGAAFTQLYRYDDDTGVVECVSCTDPASGGLAVPRIALASNRPAISTDGQTIAFATDAKLVPQDINGRFDVYEWHDGLIRLVTDGESEFQDSLSGTPSVWGFSPDGRSLFFSEGGVAITGNERDTYGNVYDARVGSAGFPPKPPPAHCVEDSCQGPLVVTPPLPNTASSTFSGPGNPPARRGCRHRRHRHACKHHGRGARANHKRGGAK